MHNSNTIDDGPIFHRFSVLNNQLDKLNDQITKIKRSKRTFHHVNPKCTLLCSHEKGIDEKKKCIDKCRLENMHQDSLSILNKYPGERDIIESEPILVDMMQRHMKSEPEFKKLDIPHIPRLYSMEVTSFLVPRSSWRMALNLLDDHPPYFQELEKNWEKSQDTVTKFTRDHRKEALQYLNKNKGNAIQHKLAT